MAGTDEVQYLVLPDPTNPYFLARVRWPDVCQAMSPVRPYWQDDPGLFDLPYDPSSMPVTLDQAVAIAAAWGASVSSDAPDRTSELPLMRRMPADWSNLSRAEQRAWSIEFMKAGKRAEAGEESSRGRRAATSGSRLGRWRLRRRGPAVGADVIDLTGKGADVIDLIETGADVIDLTDTTDDAAAAVEGA